MLAGLNASTSQRIGLVWFDANRLAPEDVHRLIRQLADRVPVVSGTLASYDPSCDAAGHMRDIALELLALLADVATPADWTRAARAGS